MRAGTSFLVCVVALAYFASCAIAGELRVGGRTPLEEFSDPHVAALVEAACSGSKSGAETALKEGARVNATGRWGETPLFWSLACENVEGTEFLLSMGADPNLEMSGHVSATYEAATRWNPAFLRLLLLHGGNPNASQGPDASQTALTEAFNVGHQGHGWTNYYTLLDAGADINRGDSIGNTIAIWEVANHDFDKVIELIARGYNYDFLDLAYKVQMSTVNEKRYAELAESRNKLIRVLEDKGIQFPLPPLHDTFLGRATMSKDRTLHITWWGENHELADVHGEIVKPDNAKYAALLKRIGNILPGYGAYIPK